MMEYIEYALPLLIVAAALVIWLAIHRRYKRNVKSRVAGLFSHEKELALLDQNELLTAEERRRIRMAIAKKMKQIGEEKTGPPTRKLPVDIRELLDQYPPDDQ
jgi:hypothetical protein